ncbi:MFS transporter [Chroococcidiopsis sp. FACHB-1243]|uniref:MFS transporter n=1 Tax=Chroococcidiopsis sp. [FACHB-1243] TaxID=2692781 RepID=UPI00177C1439|nr:MFS transporter [Chroococcidiopsis sp. [FACHB-1243]]MBD2304353.1 MFS transporter [Chroococcidiopsis sp. [FACHB-1243]]
MSALSNTQPLAAVTELTTTHQPPIISKPVLRTSLKASTIDGVFAAIFSSVTSGVLLTNFLLQLGANPLEVGMLSSIPMLTSLLQPLGAYLAERSSSRHFFCWWTFIPARLLWLIPIAGICWIVWFNTNSHQLVSLTLVTIFASNILAGLGTSSWLSWMAALVPHRLRGRYFGLRNSAASLTTLIAVPLAGFAISILPGSTIQGYGIVLGLGIIAGILSLACQNFMVDVNPQLPPPSLLSPSKSNALAVAEVIQPPPIFSLFRDLNFVKFLLYFGLWAFAVNLIVPFYNLYLLDNLKLDLNWVSLYTSLHAGTNLVMLLIWGKLADRLGNRPLLLIVGILVGVLPLFWLGTGNNLLSLWLWLPLIHLVKGSLWAAIDLCSNNIQMELAPKSHPSSYFAIAAATAGVFGALGTTVGSQLTTLDAIGGLPGVFIISTIVRLLALFPLIFVREPRSQPLKQVLRHLRKPQLVTQEPTTSATNSAQ